MYPGGDILRVNHELSVAISKGLQILGYFELPEEDQPKTSIWNHPELLDDWFKLVKERRLNPNTEKIADEWNDVDLDQNELTKGLR
jgi:hypothetical protein